MGRKRFTVTPSAASAAGQPLQYRFAIAHAQVEPITKHNGVFHIFIFDRDHTRFIFWRSLLIPEHDL